MGIEVSLGNRHHARHRLAIIEQRAPDHRLYHAHLAIDGAVVWQRPAIGPLLRAVLRSFLQ
ncbi:hypothetical protein AX777_23855 [Sphingobium yanoikuyae]|uniref:Uncharacterized protein n=1 Tax=Sphingobium yanoikuyae TaxID=13690 RepID=A0A177JLY5_SPHYA|nr:hypothetical protein AX777_23855 [Sphingobium yanoikuyae]